MKRARVSGSFQDAARAANAEPLRILRRDRSGQVRRRRRYRGGLLLGAALGALALLGGAAYGARRYLTHSPRFVLRRIEISETRYAPASKLKAVLQPHLGRNLFRLDPARLGRDLEARRWVKRAVVKRVLPDGLFCAIEERVPRGLALLRDRVWLVDGEGVGINPYAGGDRRYSYPILINATEADTVADAVPDPGAFDHFVVGVAWPKDAPVPDGVGSALLEAPGIGKVLVVDTTDEYAWPGTLPANLAGRRGALITADRGILVTMPAGEPATHRIERSTVLTFAKDGGAGVAIEVKYFGWPAEAARAAYAGSAVERRESVEDDARRAWSGAEVTDYASTVEAGDGAYVETLKLDLPAGSAELKDGLLRIFAGMSGDLSRVPLTKRKGPIVFESPVRVSYVASIVGAPEGGLPTSHEASGNGWTVRSGVSREGGTVRGSLVYERTRTRFDPEAFPEVKQMWSAVSKAGSAAISLRPE